MIAGMGREQLPLKAGLGASPRPDIHLLAAVTEIAELA
jgi:hypothetical protein